jgi:hypothetical protein
MDPDTEYEKHGLDGKGANPCELPSRTPSCTRELFTVHAETPGVDEEKGVALSHAKACTRESSYLVKATTWFLSAALCGLLLYWLSINQNGACLRPSDQEHAILKTELDVSERRLPK